MIHITTDEQKFRGYGDLHSDASRSNLDSTANLEYLVIYVPWLQWNTGEKIKEKKEKKEKQKTIRTLRTLTYFVCTL